MEPDEKQVRPIRIREHVQYADGAIVSKTLLDRKTGTITLFSFDAGEGLSEHTAPFDAVVQVVDGRALVTIGGVELEVRTGELVVMPAGVPHALRAPEPFKMMLVMIRS
ncbi:MAG: cupin domain-containing protein [Deltaproteobacteria bacterium]|nr:cupin domain-containing protein [Deltaproteobacteria bacterium]